MAIPKIPTLLLVPGDSSPDYTAIFGIAVSYADAGLVVSDYGENADRPEMAFPAIVCSSFAIELFLKFFVSVEMTEKGNFGTKPIQEHKISALWKMISDDRRNLIVGMFRNKSGVPVTNAIERRTELFLDFLQEIGDAPFIEWRYAHESKSSKLMSHSAIHEVVDALGYAANYLLKTKNHFKKEIVGHVD